MPADFAKNLLAFTDAPFKDTDAREAAVINVSVHSITGDNVIDVYNFAPLASAVDTTNALLDAHGIPRQVIVYHHVTELIVQAFRADFCEKHDVNGFRVILREFKPSPEIQPVITFNATIDLLDTKSRFSQLSFDIIQRVAECAEQDDFIIFRFLLFSDNLEHPIEFRVVLRQVIRHFQNVLCDGAECLQVHLTELAFIKIKFRVVRHLLESAVNDTPNVRSKAKDAACSLTANR